MWPYHYKCWCRASFTVIPSFQQFVPSMKTQTAISRFIFIGALDLQIIEIVFCSSQFVSHRGSTQATSSDRLLCITRIPVRLENRRPLCTLNVLRGSTFRSSMVNDSSVKVFIRRRIRYAVREYEMLDEGSSKMLWRENPSTNTKKGLGVDEPCMMAIGSLFNSLAGELQIAGCSPSAPKAVLYRWPAPACFEMRSNVGCRVVGVVGGDEFWSLCCRPWRNSSIRVHQTHCHVKLRQLLFVLGWHGCCFGGNNAAHRQRTSCSRVRVKRERVESGRARAEKGENGDY